METDIITITQKLLDLAYQGAFINKSLLEQHGLATTQTVLLLYKEDLLDYISFEEAINASLKDDRREISRRRRAIDKERNASAIYNDLRGKYTPCTLLNTIEAYKVILKKRDEYMPIANAMNLLNIKCRGLIKKGDLIWGKYITIENINKVKIFLAESLPVKDAAKEAGFDRSTLYRLAKNKDIKIVSGRIRREDLKQLQSLREISVQEVMSQLHITKATVYIHAKRAGVSFDCGYISKDAFQILMERKLIKTEAARLYHEL